MADGMTSWVPYAGNRVIYAIQSGYLHIPRAHYDVAQARRCWNPGRSSISGMQRPLICISFSNQRNLKYQINTFHPPVLSGTVPTVLNFNRTM